MTKAVTSDMVEPDLNDEFRPQRLPFPASFGAPAAGTTRRFSGEAGRLAKSLKPLSQAWTLFIGEGSGEADMVESALGIIEPEK